MAGRGSDQQFDRNQPRVFAPRRLTPFLGLLCCVLYAGDLRATCGDYLQQHKLHPYTASPLLPSDEMRSLKTNLQVPDATPPSNHRPLCHGPNCQSRQPTRDSEYPATLQTDHQPGLSGQAACITAVNPRQPWHPLKRKRVPSVPTRRVDRPPRCSAI